VKPFSVLQQRWGALENVIDSRNPRERLLLFFATLAVVYLVCQLALFKPLRAHQAALRQRLTANQADFSALQIQTEEMLAKTRQDPDLPNRRRLAELTRQLDAVDAPLAEVMKSLVSPKEMNALVKAVLSDHRQLNVVSLVNIAPEAVRAKDAAGGTKPVNAAAPLYKHGLRIEFKGSFRDIVGFFSDLEKLSWKVLWDEADIKTEHYPESTATVTVYTLSTDEAWISL
jgi:MSHA biogenesis protein MshJ